FIVLPVANAGPVDGNSLAVHDAITGLGSPSVGLSTLVGLGFRSHQLLHFRFHHRLDKHLADVPQKIAQTGLRQFGDVGGLEAELDRSVVFDGPAFKLLYRVLFADLISFLHCDSPWIAKLPRAYQALGESRHFLRSAGHLPAMYTRLYSGTERW